MLSLVSGVCEPCVPFRYRYCATNGCAYVDTRSGVLDPSVCSGPRRDRDNPGDPHRVAHPPIVICRTPLVRFDA